MMVEKSQDLDLIGEIIIPISRAVDIEQMIDDIAINNEQVCLRGQLYKFNLNLFKIDPDGKKFEVISQENTEMCAAL
ncbi:MAG: hypothetical protein GY816_10135 [Cytophagales bacterium]|nr:hypothetical protein [Cytophagales bacterium]